MDWLAFSLAVGTSHANGDPIGFSQYHSGFFKADPPHRRAGIKNPFVRA
jgi:hypothetical protein